MAGPQHAKRFPDYLDLLRLLNESQAEACVVGGQAVNLWAEIFREDEPELLQYAPFTSEDLDLHRLSNPARRLLRARARHTEYERDPFGKAFTIVSQTFIVERGAGEVLPIDELKMVAGLKPAEVERSTVTVEFSGVLVRVLNPISCLKAKLYNLRTINQEGRQDLKHVRILLLCARGFIRGLFLDAGRSGNYRPTIKALKQAMQITSHAAAIKTARAHGLDLVHTVPLAELDASQDPKITRFVSTQLRRWQRLHST